MKKSIYIFLILSLFLLGTCFSDSNDETDPGDTDTEVIPQIEYEPNACDIDNDGDFFGEGCEMGLDCNDDDPEINPYAFEICDDEIDNDCDGFIDMDEKVCFGGCVDADGDGYSEVKSEFARCSKEDCDDTDPSINPEAAEVCADDIDNNCDELIDDICCGDGLLDEPYESCDDGGATEECTSYCMSKEQNYGAPCHCIDGTGCDIQDFSAGVISGCDNVIVPEGLEFACYYSVIIEEADNEVWAANGYCTAMALKCEQLDGYTDVCDTIAPHIGDYENFNECPPGTVMEQMVREFIFPLTGTPMRFTNFSCMLACEDDDECRGTEEGDTDADADIGPTHYKCLESNLDPSKKYCYDERNQ